MRRQIGIAGGIVALSALFFPVTTTAQAACPGGAGHVAVAMLVSGEAVLDRLGSAQALLEGSLICPGDGLSTGETGRIELQFRAKDTVFGITSNSALRIPDGQTASNARLERGQGRFVSSVRDFFSVETRHGNAGIDGTEAVIAIDALSGTSLVLVVEGDVTFTPTVGAGLAVAAGAAVIAGEGGAEAAEAGNVPPAFRGLLADPDGATDWAIHYPLGLLAEAGPGAVADALARLDAGDPDGAERSLSAAGETPRALALSSIIRTSRGDPAAGRALAARAIAADPGFAPGHLALSYALQGGGDVDAALGAAADAVTAAPGDPYARARLAELALTRGDLLRAERLAAEALATGETALAHVVLGFARLSAHDATGATIAFMRAAEIDGGDPLPRLGLGLVAIRGGELAEGRRRIELAVALDPRRASLRAWLGRAYLAEGLGDKAESQLDLAKRRDPDDPAPWLFSAAIKFEDNRPIAALRDLEEARQRGPGRAVLRSEAGLGEDKALRAAAIGRALDTVGFTERALAEAARAVEADPGNGAGHRLMGDLLAGRERVGFAEASAALRSSLLEPASLAPLDAAAGEADLVLLETQGPARASFAEYSPFFEQDGLRLRLSAFGGTQSTVGNSLSFTAKAEGVSLALGQFHYETDGYSPNNDVQHDVVAIQLKGEVTPWLTLFGEYRYRNSTGGDRTLDFDLADTDLLLRQGDERNTFRLGAHGRIGADHSIIGVYSHVDRQIDLVSEPGLLSIARQRGEETGDQFQLQHIGRFGRLTTVSGISWDRSSFGFFGEEEFNFFFPFPFPPILINFVIVDPPIVGELQHLNAYHYSTWRSGKLGPLAGVELTGGLSIDHFDAGQAGGPDETHVNPKLGLRVDVTSGLRFRAAHTRAVAPGLIFGQRLEPSTVAGFVQLRDDVQGSHVVQTAAALEVELADGIWLGIEGARRRSDTPQIGMSNVESREREVGAYLDALLGERVAVRLYGTYEDAESDLRPDLDGWTTVTVGGQARYFSPTGFFAGVGLEYVMHNFGDTALGTGDDQFLLGNLSVGYRLPDKRGVLSVDVTNGFDSSFGFQDRPSRRFTAVQVAEPRYAREFTVFARATFQFDQ